MKFANIRELKLETNKVLKMSEKGGPVVILRNGKPVAVVRSVSEKDFSLKMDSLWPRLRKAAEKSGYGPQDVDKLVESVREGK
jgi:prevent-host-death family protein